MHLSLRTYVHFVFLLISVNAMAEEYYDYKTRRYVETQEFQAPQQRMYQVKKINAIPTREEIEAERLRARMERDFQQRRLENIKNSPSTQSLRKYDPNRYHNTEEVNFIPGGM